MGEEKSIFQILLSGIKNDKTYSDQILEFILLVSKVNLIGVLNKIEAFGEDRYKTFTIFIPTIKIMEKILETEKQNKYLPRVLLNCYFFNGSHEIDKYSNEITYMSFGNFNLTRMLFDISRKDKSLIVRDTTNKFMQYGTATNGVVYIQTAGTEPFLTKNSEIVQNQLKLEEAKHAGDELRRPMRKNIKGTGKKIKGGNDIEFYGAGGIAGGILNDYIRTFNTNDIHERMSNDLLGYLFNRNLFSIPHMVQYYDQDPRVFGNSILGYSSNILRPDFITENILNDWRSSQFFLNKSGITQGNFIKMGRNIQKIKEDLRLLSNKFSGINENFKKFDEAIFNIGKEIESGNWETETAKTSYEDLIKLSQNITDSIKSTQPKDPKTEKYLTLLKQITTNVKKNIMLSIYKFLTRGIENDKVKLDKVLKSVFQSENPEIIIGNFFGFIPQNYTIDVSRKLLAEFINQNKDDILLRNKNIDNTYSEIKYNKEAEIIEN